MSNNWMADAICRGKTHLFFAPASERPAHKALREAEARAMCEQCPVRVPCANAGQTGELNDEHQAEQGMWGGSIPVCS